MYATQHSISQRFRDRGSPHFQGQVSSFQGGGGGGGDSFWGIHFYGRLEKVSGCSLYVAGSQMIWDTALNLLRSS